MVDVAYSERVQVFQRQILDSWFQMQLELLEIFTTDDMIDEPIMLASELEMQSLENMVLSFPDMFAGIMNNVCTMRRLQVRVEERRNPDDDDVIDELWLIPTPAP